MTDAFLDLLNWCHANVASNWQPQIIAGGLDKKAWAWLPGGRTDAPFNYEGAEASQIADLLHRAPALGIAPGFYQHPNVHQYKQPLMIGWVGLDIDIEANENHERIWSALDSTCENYLVRSSSGGRGLHLFRRLYSPLWLDTSAKRNHVVSRITMRLIGELPPAIQSHVCSSDYRNFWVEGGAQVTLHTPDHTADLQVTGDWLDEVVNAPAADSSPLDDAGEIDERILEIVNRLKVAGVTLKPNGRTQVVIRQVYNALKGTAWEFETKSRMRHGETQTNGFVEVNPQSLVIYAAADGRSVLRVRGLAYMRRVVGA